MDTAIGVAAALFSNAIGGGGCRTDNIGSEMGCSVAGGAAALAV